MQTATAQTATEQLTLFGVSAEPQTSRRPVTLGHSSHPTPRALRNDKRLLIQAASQAQRAADFIRNRAA